MEYKIVSIDESIGQIVVAYFDADGEFGRYAVDVPVKDGVPISGAELDVEIMSRAPVWLVNRRAEVAAADFSQIKTLISSQVHPTDSETLEGMQRTANFEIDAKAGEVRKRFVTATAMQSTVYYIKAEQAKAFKDAGYQGTVPPYIAASAAALNRPPQEIADEVLYLHNQWVNVIDPIIEAKRLAGKKLVNEAATVEALNEARDLAIEELHNILPIEELRNIPPL